MNAAQKTQWIASTEEQIASMFVGLSWDPTDDGDAECIAVGQILVNEWCEAVAA